MKKQLIGSKWSLYYFPQTEREASPEDLKGRAPIEATVPGNVEIDLMREGVLPKDLYKGENVLKTEDFELYEWWYETKFVMPETEGKTHLCFEGVDCLAEYWLDGVKIGESENMFIPIKLPIENPIEGKEYTLHVRIRSAVLEDDKYSSDMLNMYTWDANLIGSASLRKAPHSYGWDIMPRLISAGIWKDVYIVSENKYDLNQFAYKVYTATEELGVVKFFYELGGICPGCTIEIVGECGDSKFKREVQQRSKAGTVTARIANPKLWYPKNYGEPNLYKTTVRVIADGKVMSEQTINVGIRIAELRRTDKTDGENGKFHFFVNNTLIMCYGTNWVPMDPLHSREKDRYAKALELLDDIGCNCVRWWGGNVYPEDLFFDFCDSHGIMVWQDFAMACGTYPQDDEFAKKMEIEAESVVRRFRNHPSLVVWSGDNECDIMTWQFVKLKENRITREVLPEIVGRNDVTRDYLPSSPYIARGVRAADVPEKHLWGPRDYYKSSYYKDTNAHFASELGYHGCPSPVSIKKFINGDLSVEEMKNNKECILHSTTQSGSNSRFMLMEKQIKQIFGEVPGDVDNFALASQISQAEAKKFFIEMFRTAKPTKSGLIWWNLLDGWPQFSDAVVDYYYDKKLAYHYIKKCQEPVCVMMKEMENWSHNVVIANDTLKDICVDYKVTDLDDGRVVAEGKATISANGIKTVRNIPLFYSDKKMFKIDYTVDGVAKQNHYLAGFPPFSLEQYKSWMTDLGYKTTFEE